MTQEKEYTLGNGLTYVQRPLVIGQVKQMKNLLSGVDINMADGVQGIIDALGDKLLSATAIVLTEKGKSPRDKDIDSLAGELEYAMTPLDILQVVDDFFICNPVSSLLERIAQTMSNATGAIRTAATILPKPSSSSPEGISPDGTPSSGAIH